MSAEEKNKLDDIFKSGLDVPDSRFEYDDQHWDNMEQLMDAHSRPRRIVYWLPRLGAVAAVLLLFLGWWLFKPAKQVNNNNVAVIKQPAVKASVNKIGDNTGNNKGASAQTPANNPVNPTVTANNNSSDQQPVKANQPSAPIYAKVKPNVKIYTPSSQTSGGNAKQNDVITAPVAKNAMLATVDVQKNNTVNNTDKPVTDTQVAQANGATVNQDAIANVPVQPLTDVNGKLKKVKAAATMRKGPTFGLAVIFSPDINGAGSFQNAKIGINIGMLFSVGFGKKLTISTGAAYSKKPYMTDFDNYHVGYKFKTDPQNVYADCRVLDIPLNVDYKVYSKSRNSFSIGSGLSSYIMLRETYSYNYAVPGTAGPASFTVNNKNRHILGVLNLNATYEHQLNSKFSIAAQPYLKIPLTDIGNSQVRLQSAGVALGLRWNINHASITP